MKRLTIFLLCMVMVAFAQKGNSNALGLYVGNEHWGFDWKHRTGSDKALDLYGHVYLSDDVADIGLSLGFYTHYYGVFNIDRSSGRIPLYWGPFGGINFWSDDNDYHYGNTYYDRSAVYVRAGIVGGIAWELPVSIPMELWFEMNPVAEFWSEDYGNAPNYDGDRNNHWEIPELYIRFGYRVFFF
jgi:hypothetical protein